MGVDRGLRVDLGRRAPLGTAQIRLVNNFVTIRDSVVREVGREKGRRKGADSLDTVRDYPSRPGISVAIVPFFCI